MPHTRSPYCTVTAVSLSRDLLGRITREARRRGWTRAGFIRYAAARELGWSASQARDLLQPQQRPSGRVGGGSRPAAGPPKALRAGAAGRAVERLLSGRSPLR